MDGTRARALLLVVLYAVSSSAAAFADDSGGGRAVNSVARQFLEKADGILDSGLRWDGPVGRAALSLVESLLRPAARAIAALERAATALPAGDIGCNASLAGVEASANATSVSIDGLSTVQPFELEPTGKDRMAATSSFRTLKAIVHADAAVFGPFGLDQRAKLICRANLSNVSMTITWRVATLAGRARAALHGAVEGVTAAHTANIAAHAAAHAAAISSNTPPISLEDVSVEVGGDIAISVTDADGGGAPPVLWRLLSRTLQRTLKEMVEQHVAEAAREVLAPLTLQTCRAQA